MNDMTKKCMQCRYCRVKVSVWLSALVIVTSVTMVATGLVPVPA